MPYNFFDFCDEQVFKNVVIEYENRRSMQLGF